MLQLIDGHLDLAMNALLYERSQTLPVDALRQREAGEGAEDRGTAMVSLPELRQAGAGIVAATLIARCKPWADPARRIGRSDLDYPDPAMAYAAAQGQLAYYQWLESCGEVRILRDAAAFDEHVAQWQSPSASARLLPVGLVLLMEGADPIVEPGQVERWHGQGVRLVGLAHFGHSRYAAGTPPMDPSRGEGDGPLTPLGVELLERMAKLNVALDLSHLSDLSFDEAMDLFPGKVCASHSNARTLAPTPRQLTDTQIRRIVQRDGVIGMAMHYAMLQGGHGAELKPADVGLMRVAEHVDHICQLAGSANHVALGSDLDGGFGSEATPRDLRRYADLHKVGAMLGDRGLSDADIVSFFKGNWLRFYREALFSREAQRSA